MPSRRRANPPGEQGKPTGITADQARTQLEEWPDAPKNMGQTLIENYGPPHEMTPAKMFWYRVGSWAQMEVTADEVVHNFPTPRTDFFAQFVEYPVDQAKMAEVATFDGSVVINRTAGQIGSRCDTEGANTMTLNVLVDLLEGRKSLDEAREFLDENLAAFGMGRDALYAEKLQFTPRTGFPGSGRGDHRGGCDGPDQGEGQGRLRAGRAGQLVGPSVVVPAANIRVKSAEAPS